MTISDWARELDAAYTIARRLVTTPFAPKHFQGKPEDAAAAILTGYELGLTPMASLRSIFMISGTPGLYAKVMVAVAQSRGHKVWVAEQSDDRVVVKGQRRGEPEIYETVWTPERCKLAGLDSNPKYRTARQQMMVARGQSEIARQVAADALHGVPYSVEELEDFPVRATARVTGADLLDDIPAIRPNQTAVTTNDPRPFDGAVLTVRALSPATEDPEPLTVDERAAIVAELPAMAEQLEPQGISGPQMRKLQALFKEAGIDDRASRLAWASDVVGRELASSNDLTRVEAGKVIEAVEAFIAERVQAAAEVNAEAQPELAP